MYYYNIVDYYIVGCMFKWNMFAYKVLNKCEGKWGYIDR